MFEGGVTQTHLAEVMVIDDNPGNLSYLESLLTEEGYLVRAVNSSLFALKSIQAHLPDLILLDVKMPEVDGYELCRRLKADPQTKDVPVIFVSVLDRPEDHVKGFDSGGIDYISKPIHRQEVLARVRTHIALYQMQTKLEALVEERTTEIRQSTTELLTTSDLLKAVYEANPDLQFVLDMNGIITNYHTQNEEGLYTTPENFIGKTMQQVLPVDVGEQFKNAFGAAATSNSLVTIEYMLSMPTGDFTYEARIISLQDKRLVVTVRDITERIQMEEEILKARKLKSMGVLAGGIAHDFNNILTGLFGNIELAKMKLSEEHAAYTYIDSAHHALERAANLTKQLLTFAKGGDPLLESVDITQVIRDSTEFSLSGSNIKTVQNLPDNLWQGKVDKGQVSQVIGNLAINAKQAMPDGGILTIDAVNVKDIKDNAVRHLSGDYIKISIRDEGIGISDKHLEKVFDPYFTTKQAGSGLGLTSVHSIVTKHNGHISIDSELGVGTTITLYFPAEISPDKTTDTVPLSVVEKSESSLGHILIMDDDVMVRNLSVDMLVSCGFSVDTAEEGKEALEKYISAAKSDKPFDIVIMDLTIPGGMGGKEAISELLAIDPKAKVVVSSGYSTDPIMANYGDYGFKGRLAKPFRMGDMEQVLFRVMALG